MSETWLNDINEDYVNVTGYRLISSNRVGKLGEGAGLYLRDTFTLNVMSDLCSSNTALFDSVFLKSKIRMEKTLSPLQFIVLLLLICMNSWNLFG